MKSKLPEYPANEYDHYAYFPAHEIAMVMETNNNDDYDDNDDGDDNAIVLITAMMINMTTWTIIMK